MIPNDDRWLAGDAYEAFMGRWSRPVARSFLEWLAPASGAHWLEIGCGTGALTSAICREANPGSVVACDPSAAFVEDARRRVADPRARFTQGSADALPARDGGFDAIVSGLVLNFVPEPAAATAAMRERLSPGGLVAAYVWDYAGRMEFLRFFWDEAVALDPAAAPLDEGKRFPLCRSEALEALFRGAGLHRVERRALEHATDFENFDDFWTPLLGGTGPAAAYVTSLDGERRESLRARMEKRLAAGKGRPIRLVARAWAIRGFATA